MHDPNLIVLHNHVHLAVLVDGRNIIIPANISLGQFLDIWGLDFGISKSVKMTVNGIDVDTIAYDYRKYLLQDGVSIVLEFGS